MPFPVDSSFITRAEQLLGLELPRWYKQRMQSCNGGTVMVAGEHWELYPILDDSDHKRLTRTCNDVLHETKVACEWHLFPPEALALASDGAGNQLVFLPSAGNTAFGSAVYHWDHETGSLTKVADELGLESLDAG